jgi:hypothetical protein
MGQQNKLTIHYSGTRAEIRSEGFKNIKSYLAAMAVLNRRNKVNIRQAIWNGEVIYP